MTKKTMASLADQLRAQGVSPHGTQFQIATLKFHNAGGSRDEALAIVEAVFTPVAGMPSTAIDTSPPPSDEPTYSHRHRRRRRMPGHARRGARAIDAIQPTIAQSLLDTYKLPDGRTLREIRWCDAPALAARYNHHSRVLMACHNFARPADETATLDSVVSEAELRSILAASERFHVAN